MINWAYVAGFFDGEGSITNRIGCATPQISMCQSRMRGFNTLSGIQAFLCDQGIKSSTIYEIKNSRLGKQRMWQLKLHRVEEALQFLTGVLPYLHVKRADAQDLLRFRKMWPPVKWRTYEKHNGRRGK